MFDIIDDNNDELEYTDEELNRYFQLGHLNSIIDDEELIDDASVTDMLDIEVSFLLVDLYRNLVTLYFIYH